MDITNAIMDSELGRSAFTVERLTYTRTAEGTISRSVTHEAGPRGNRLDAGRFFRRRRRSYSARQCEYVPVSCPNIDEFLFLPVALGYWKQHELWDGTYTLDDLLDIAELAEVRNMSS